jgi:hypothetical protein
VTTGRTGSAGVGTDYITFGSQDGGGTAPFIGLAYEAAFPMSCNRAQMTNWDANVHAYWGTGL